MNRLALALALLWGAPAFAQSGSGELSSLRRALAIDPFAIAPYRLLTTGTSPADRRKLVEELARGPGFADKVLGARVAMDAGLAPRARELLATAVPLLPQETRTLDAFTQLAMSAGAFNLASVSAQLALVRGRTPARLVTAAIAELRQGKRKEGLALLDEARKKDPSGGATEAALDTLLGQRMIAEAAELLRAQLDPADAQTVGNATQWRRLADLERQLGRGSDAAGALLRALDAETSPTGRRSTAQAILRVYREKKALPELLKLLKTAKTSPRLVLRGDVEAELGHAHAAQASWEAAALANPADVDPTLRLAAAAKSPADRAARFEALVASHPGELRFALELADLRFAMKDVAAGRKALRDAAARFPATPSAQEQLARRMTEHGDLEGALACRKRVAEADPRSAEAVLQLGDAHRALGHRAEAVTAYGDSIARAGAGRAAYERAIEAMERGSYDAEADVRYVEARAKWPGDMSLIRRHAETLERRKELRRALDAWKELKVKATRPFDKEAAEYHVKRLEDAVLMEKPR